MMALRIPAGLAVLLAGCGIAMAAPPATPLPGARAAQGHQNIAQAYLADPTGRYAHFVLGADYEAASLVVVLKDGRTVKLTLPPDEVFEDRTPRLADLNGDGTDEIVLVRSSLRSGSSLVVIAERAGRLAIIAETPGTGAPKRWLNPAGIADFDGDGRLDIGYVQQPHVLGLLKIVTLSEGTLREIASFPGVSNHAAGSNQQGLAAVADFNGDGAADLAIPSFDRQSLVFLSFRDGPHVLKRVPLQGPATSDFKLIRDGEQPAVSVGLSGGRRQMVPFTP